MPGQREEHDQPADRRGRRQCRRRISRARAVAGIAARSTPGADGEDERRQTAAARSPGRAARSRMMVANADVGVQTLAPGQQIRPQHLAGARRQQEAGGKADDRRFEGVENRVGPIGASSDCHRHARIAYVSPVTTDARRSSEPAVGAARFGPDAGEIGVAEEERQQPDREQKDEDGANSVAAWVVQSGLESGGCSVGPVQPWPDFPANSTTRSAPSLWENVSYCSSSRS